MSAIQDARDDSNNTKSKIESVGIQSTAINLEVIKEGNEFSQISPPLSEEEIKFNVHFKLERDGSLGQPEPHLVAALRVTSKRDILVELSGIRLEKLYLRSFFGKTFVVLAELTPPFWKASLWTGCEGERHWRAVEAAAEEKGWLLKASGRQLIIPVTRKIFWRL